MKIRCKACGTDVRQATNVRTIEVCRVDFSAYSVFEESPPANSLAVGREEWSAVIPNHVGYSPNITALRLHDIEIHGRCRIDLEKLLLVWRQFARIGSSIRRECNVFTVG